MIRTLNAGSFLQVEGVNHSDPYINYNNGATTGMVRYVNNTFQVYDGNIWQNIGQSYPMIKLTESATKAINWALKEMETEEKIEELGKDSPAIQAALDNFRRAAEQLKATIILSQNE